jgi:cytochrome c oxidase subunit 2
MSPGRFAALLAATPVPAFAGIQSALDPKGVDAAKIAEISWVIFVGGGLIFLVVMALLAVALLGPPSVRASLGRYPWIIGGGIAFPVVVLTALLIYSFLANTKMVRAGVPGAVQIQVIGERWWWRVLYLDNQGRTIVETANDIRIPARTPVEFLLTSDNVIHSFWVPNLAGKTDMIPGRVNTLAVRANETGIFRGQCAEYCGAQHAKMAFHVGAYAVEDFEAWLAWQTRPAREPDTPMLVRGKQLFLSNACIECHVIRGTPANGKLGPDLTHVGSRLSIAAGILPNNIGSLAGWIAGSQHIKPGNHMPSFGELPPEDLRAIAAYMESLK